MIATALVLASASAQAVEPTIDALISAANSLTNTLDGGLQVVGGMMGTTSQGNVIQTGATQSYLVTQQQANTYNDAVYSVWQTNYGVTAEEYLGAQSARASDTFSSAIDSYVGAVYSLIEVVKVEQLAQTAQTGTVQQQKELKTYVQNNDVTLDATEVSNYNESLVGVEFAAQSYAAISAIKNNSVAVDRLQQAADEVQADFADAADAFFNSNSLSTEISFVSGNNIGLILTEVVSDFVQPTQFFLDAGATNGFYTTGPTQDSCFFTQTSEERAACEAANGA